MTDQLDCLTTALADRYTIERQLGAGGMATVYLAHDVKHDRKVAVKVLRPELAAVLGAERFVQEIKTTANLQHPHLLPLFDSGEADGFLYYVMPFIEGETLRGKLNRETQLGIEEAVKIATDVADALDYAHRKNVIHRDIKPENILLDDGQPMVADFGIALAVSAAAGGRMTETGFSLGTPHYMSPEQATAEKDLTNRSDIYSLGAVLYEMLTGDPPHTGSSAQQIIMKIVTDEPRPVTELRKSVPPNVAAATAKALEKLPADRFVSAAAFVGALRDVTAIPPALSPKRLERAAVTRTARMGWVVGTIGVALAAWALFGSRGESNPQSVRYLNILLPDSAPLAFIGEGTLGAGRRALALSPDGQTLVYAASGRGSDQLYRRELADFMATPIAGTDSAFSPFISPDGQWVGFFVGAELRKASMGGGAAVRLAPVPESIGAAWNHDGRILVSAREGTDLGWVPEGGGPIQEIPNPQAVRRIHPSILPDGRHALVAIFNRTLVGPIVGVTDLESGRTVALTAAGLVVTDSVEPSAAIRGTEPQYLSSGHLVYSTPAGLVAVAFDPVKLELKGRPVEVLSGVRRDALGVHYAVGKDGTLVFAAGGDGNVGALVWASRDGAVDSLGFAPQPYGTFELSPDGRRLAALVYPAIGAAELWVYDLRRGTRTKVPTRGAPHLPRWWPDGRRIVFTETSAGFPYARVSVRQLVESAGERDTLGVDWDFSDFAPDTSRGVGQISLMAGAWIFPLQPGKDPVPLDSFPGAWGPMFSPDGRRIAYTSNESGQYEVYVAAADRPGVREQISLAGGEEPVWAPGGNELIYRWGQEWFAVAVPDTGSATFGRPRVIFRGPYVNVAWRSHDLAPDGRRHLLVLGPLEQSTNHLHVITNWLDEVTRRVER